MEHLVDIPTIPEVFNGKKVLITGATGFVGKVSIIKTFKVEIVNKFPVQL